MSLEGTTAASGSGGVVEEGSRTEALRDTLRNQRAAISRRDLLLQDGEPNPMSIRSMNSLALFMSGKKMKTQRHVLNVSTIQEEDDEDVPESGHRSCCPEEGLLQQVLGCFG
jgi:hypothetical protein